MKKYVYFLTLLILLIYCPVSGVRAQSASWGSWVITTVQVPGGERGWGGFFEAQARMNGIARQFNYHEFKGGVSYDIGKNFTTLLGIGRYTTYETGELNATPLVRETRLWQQLIQSQNIGRLKFEHRYRVEQRWLDRRDTDTFRNRIRYRLNIQVPLNAQETGPGTWFVATYNELFLNPNLVPFERNRFYAGLGYQLSPHWIVQAGWLNQFDYAPGPPRHKNNVVLTAVFRVPRLKPGLFRLPTPFD